MYNIRIKRDNRWKWIRHSSGEIKTFFNKRKAKRYIKNHMLELEDQVQIVPGEISTI